MIVSNQNSASKYSETDSFKGSYYFVDTYGIIATNTNDLPGYRIIRVLGLSTISLSDPEIGKLTCS